MDKVDKRLDVGLKMAYDLYNFGYKLNRETELELDGKACQSCFDAARAILQDLFGEEEGDFLAGRETSTNVADDASLAGWKGFIQEGLEDYRGNYGSTAKRNPTKRTKSGKPRLTHEQKQALDAYNFALREEDRYLGSVFATKQGQDKVEAKTKAAYEKCKALGMTWEHGL